MAKSVNFIDYTVDFVYQCGKLTAGAPAQAISEATQVTEEAFERGDYIFLLLMPTMRMMLFILKAAFPPLQYQGNQYRNYMDLWQISMRNIKEILGSFDGYATILLFLDGFRYSSERKRCRYFWSF